MLTGFSYVFAGFRLLGERRLRWFVLAPLSINVILFGIAIAWGVGVYERWLGVLVDWLPAWLDWVHWLLWPIFGLAMILVLFYTFTIVANIVGAPLNSLLAEKVEKLGNPVTSTTPSVSFWAEIPRAIAHEGHKWLYALPRLIPLLLLFVVPGVNVAAPFLWFGFGAWMLAMEYADYPMGNHGLSFKMQRQLLRERRLVSLGFGAGVMLMTLVPVLNFLSMPTAVIGATLMWNEQFRDQVIALSQQRGNNVQLR